MAVVGLVAVTTLPILLKKSWLENKVRENTVMLLSANRRSGGSGSILSSSTHKSIVLTNRHVCNLFTKGGIVVKQTTKEEHLVVSYKRSKAHDLCLVEVYADLKGGIELAEKAPEKLDSAIISGHPGLRPISLTTGAFSETEFLEVFVGLRKCTEKEAETELVCLFLGAYPLIERYESVLVTAFIMPGSSGSAVYNKSGELSGVVFAGSRGLSFASIVPYEYVANFLNSEASKLVSEFPSNVLTAAEDSEQEKILKRCESLFGLDDKQTKEIKKVCETIQRSAIWFQQ